MTPRRFARSSAATALVAAGALWGARAAAGDKKACVDAYERAQQLRRGGALIEARKALVVCAQAGCPEAAKADCVPWLAEVDASLPSVVVAARDAAGRELFDVRVLVDGALLAPALDGKALAVDPGVHTFRYVPSAGEPVEQRVVVREGEKNRAIVVTLGAPAAAVAAAPTTAPTAPAASSPASAGARAARPIPAAVWALGGLGLVGVAAFTVVGVSSLRDESALRDTCAPRCAEDDVDAVRAKHIAADVSLGVGLVSLGAAAWLYLTRPAVAAAPSARSDRVDVVLGPRAGGAIAGVAGAF